jgi:2,5-diamino-6-(ribosylamino)-4(3H)-pyrimidinone 5'-phosphate reductase
MLHVLRRSEYCRDVVVLISERTPQDYIQYLEERDYRLIRAGEDFVDYRAAFEHLGSNYDARRVLVDTGPTLGSILLQQGLLNKISLLIHPYIVGQTGLRAFEGLQLNSLRELDPERQEMLEQRYLHLVFGIKSQE